MSQVWKACSLRRMPTISSKPRLTGPKEKVRLPRSASGTASYASIKRGVGHQGLVGLGPGRLGVPFVPDRLVEVVGRGGAGPGILEAAARNDGARSEVGEHLGDRPIVAIGRRDELGVVQSTGEFVQAID